LIKRIEEGKQVLNPNVSMGIKLAVARCLYIARANDPTVHGYTRKNSCILHQFLIRSQNSSSGMADENFFLFRTANLQSTPSGAISKCEVRDNGRE